MPAQRMHKNTPKFHDAHRGPIDLGIENFIRSIQCHFAINTKIRKKFNQNFIQLKLQLCCQLRVQTKPIRYMIIEINIKNQFVASLRIYFFPRRFRHSIKRHETGIESLNYDNRRIISVLSFIAIKYADIHI